MQIRDERPEDVSRISSIHYAAFKGHPVHPPGSEPVEHRIVERLRESGALTFSRLAEVGGEAVAHIALSPAVVGDYHNGWFLLGPVGVLPHLQGRGIGSELVRESLRHMSSRGASGVVLVGDPGFYVRFGFATVPGLVYPGVPDQYVLAAQFGYTVPLGGIVAHEAFGMTDV